ncbi:MAG: ComF family protein [Burkholderiales bacterium]|nr:ComF family protein [Burkholderiales bacterium]
MLQPPFLNSRLTFRQALFRQDCLLCAAPSGAQMLCPACHASLPHIAHACPRCAAPSVGQVCGECLKHPPAFDRTRAALEYAFPTDKLIQALKYGGQLALAKLLGELLTEAVADQPRPETILPMPLHPARLKMRGFNQALEIAKVIAKQRNIPLAPGLAQRIADTTPQASLPIGARHTNVKGAFACNKDLRGQSIAVVDDVMTSGATLHELAKILKRAGAAQVDVWVVARAVTHH